MHEIEFTVFSGYRGAAGGPHLQQAAYCTETALPAAVAVNKQTKI